VGGKAGHHDIRQLARAVIVGDISKRTFAERMRAMSADELNVLATALRTYVQRIARRQERPVHNVHYTGVES
jgi:hypothetical protein